MLDPQYVTGFTFRKIYGKDFRGDQCGYTLYGDESQPSAEWCMMAASAEIPEQAGLSGHKKAVFWFKCQDIQPYGHMVQHAQAVIEKLKNEGWKEAIAIEGYPDTGSSIDELVDTHSHCFFGSDIERNFPTTPNVDGYNGARGFKIVVEKLDEKPEFSENEVKLIDLELKGFMMQVYRRHLESVRFGTAHKVPPKITEKNTQ